MSLNTVLFDLDGTLLDRERSLRAFAEVQYDRFSQQIAPRLSKKAFMSRLIALDENGQVWKDEACRRILRESGITNPSYLDAQPSLAAGWTGRRGLRSAS